MSKLDEEILEEFITKSFKLPPAELNKWLKQALKRKEEEMLERFRDSGLKSNNLNK